MLESKSCQIAAEDDGLESKDSRLKKEGEKLNAEIERNGHVLANLRPGQPLQVLLVFFGGFLSAFGHVDLAKIVPSFVGLKKKVQKLFKASMVPCFFPRLQHSLPPFYQLWSDKTLKSLLERYHLNSIHKISPLIYS